MLKNRHRFIQPMRIMLLCASALTLTCAFADGDGGYLTDSAGQPVMSGGGECVHTGSWNKSMSPCPAPKVVVSDAIDSYVFTIDEAEYFGFNRDSLSDQAKSDLDQLADTIGNADQVRAITVTGHADNLGSTAYNRALAFRRADAVKAYLVSRGISADRILTQSEGSSGPLVSCADAGSKANKISCLSPNRRVDVDALLANHIDVRTIDYLQSGS